MSTVGAVKKKVKGQFEQWKGDINQKRGKGIKGGMQKIKGKAQETLGDIESDQQENRARGDDVDDNETI